MSADKLAVLLRDVIQQLEADAQMLQNTSTRMVAAAAVCGDTSRRVRAAIRKLEQALV